MDTKEKLKKVLLEWREFTLPPLYKRDFDPALMEGGEILSIIGARRAGKTYLCYQIINELKRTISDENILYINFEDERLYPLKGDDLSLLWDIFRELFTPKPNQKIYLFVDEIQNVKNWSKWARRITDQNKNIKLIITGSSSKLLSQEIATELRGRSISFTVYPLSFAEYLKANGIAWSKKNIFQSKERVTIKKNFNFYCKRGGFPAVLENGKPEELLKEYFRVMFYRDLIERFKIKNIKLFEDYLTLVLDQMGKTFSISATAKKLAGFGYSFSKNTLSNFSKYAQEIFLLFEVKKYSNKIKEQIRNPKKIYAIDHGMIRAIRFSFSEDYGRILENIVYLALRKSNNDVFYFSGNKECDFIVQERGKVLAAIQVTKNLASASTKDREIAGLLEAMDEFGLKEGLILTEDENDSFKVEGKQITVIPVWYWLLGNI